MGVTNTTNYNLIKPNPGEERDAWGPYLNSNMDTIDTRLKSLADSKAEKGSTNTFTASQVISVNSSDDALRITQTGAGNALVVEDSANPDSTPFVVNANGEVGLGTSNPTVKLHLVGSDDVTSTLIAGTSKAIRIVPKLTHVQFEATDNTGVGSYEPLVIGGSTLQFAIGAAEVFRIAPTGAFGVSGANYGSSGQVLISGGSAAAPAWGTLGLSGGGTGATNAAGARANLGVPGISTNNTLTGIQYFNGGVGSNFSVLAVGGSEGGQFSLEKAPSGSTLAGSVVIDTATNVFRLYEDGGTYRGAYIELTAQAAAVGSKIFTTADIIPIANGGTGSGTASGARTNLGLGALATLSAVGTAQITDANVTTAKIADANVTTAKIADSNVTTVKIADGNVTEAKLAVNSVTTGKIADANVTLAKLAAAVAQSLVPTGSVMPFAGATEPTGWLFCFGQNVSRTTYAALFAAVGTTYGAGDGSTTFTLPDLRGRVVAGQDDMGGTSANRLTNQTGGLDGDVLGATGGAETHTLTEAQMPLHGHPFRLTIQSASTASSSTTGGLMLGSTGLTNYSAFTGTPSNTAGQQIGGTGGDAAHNNVQPTIILNYIIKV